MDQNHSRSIDQEIEIMVTEMKKSPKLLRKSAGKKSCCIFRAPQSLVGINNEAYQPQIVSVGPYHNNNKDLEMIEQHKWRFLDDFIQRTGKSLGYFLKLIVSMEDEIRESYSESIDHFSTVDLAKMMVLDGVFLLELFRKVVKLVPIHEDDPIFSMDWLFPSLMKDLLKIENHIPFFVLQKLFDHSKTDHDPTLPSIILEFCNYAFQWPKEVLDEYKNLEGRHLLDFFHKRFTNTKEENMVVSDAMSKNSSISIIQPATKLMIAGVKFKASHDVNSFLDIEFQNGVLLIPRINMDDFCSSFFLNCVAFEQCYFYCSKHITSYVLFMGALMNTSGDVGLLSDSKIIENYYGKNKDIVKFFKNAGRYVAFDIKHSYLSGLFVEVNEYCKNGWHVGWSGLEWVQAYLF